MINHEAFMIYEKVEGFLEIQNQMCNIVPYFKEALY